MYTCLVTIYGSKIRSKSKAPPNWELLAVYFESTEVIRPAKTKGAFYVLIIYEHLELCEGNHFAECA
jgi:hypothetical protein